MFERLLKSILADMAPKLIPQILRSLADQIECGQISFSQETVTMMLDAPEISEAIKSCVQSQSPAD